MPTFICIYFDVYYTYLLISSDYVLDSNKDYCVIFFILTNSVLLVNYTNYRVIVINQAKWSCDVAFALNMMVYRILFASCTENDLTNYKCFGFCNFLSY